jgi:hypothetical protein
MPNGGARVPHAAYDTVAANAAKTVGGLTLDQVAAPRVYLGATPSFDTQHAEGLVKPGNLDPWNRPVLHNDDGSYSTTSSMSIGSDAGEVLIPTVVGGKRLSPDDAVAHFRATGENLGTFSTPEAADKYATALHNAQATMFDEHGNPKGAAPGSATADDWLRVLKASPNWVTAGQAIRLMDNGGRFVRARDGGFVEVPFNVSAPPTPSADAAPPMVPAPF